MNIINARDIKNSMVSISRFNKGEANKIFDEVNKSGVKIVVKNNTPACVLLSPEKYDYLIELIENNILFEEAEERLQRESKTYTQAEMMAKFNISEEDLTDCEVKIDGMND